MAMFRSVRTDEKGHYWEVTGALLGDFEGVPQAEKTQRDADSAQDADEADGAEIHQQPALGIPVRPQTQGSRFAPSPQRDLGPVVSSDFIGSHPTPNSR